MIKENTVLIVEDDNTLREVLSYNLRKEGYDVLEAADGAKALNLYRSANPSLIILDLMLPVMRQAGIICRRTLIQSGNQAGKQLST